MPTGLSVSAGVLSCCWRWTLAHIETGATAGTHARPTISPTSAAIPATATNARTTLIAKTKNLGGAMLRRKRNSVLLPLLLFVSVAHADVITGRVVKVADGDTITILDAANVQHRIRLAGIDAPEKKQAFGNVSKQSLSRFVYGKSVRREKFRKQDESGNQA